MVLAQMQVAFLWECDNWRLSPCGRQFSCLPNLVADCGQDVCLFVLDFYGPVNNEAMSSRSVNSGTVPGQA